MLRTTQSYANKQDFARDWRQGAQMRIDPRWVEEDNLPLEVICFWQGLVVHISAIDYREGLKKPLHVKRWAWPEISFSRDRYLIVHRHGQMTEGR